MQKWEYCLLGQVSMPDNGNPSMRVINPAAYRITCKGFEPMVDFKNRPKGISNEVAVGQFIAQLGEEGWEMIGAGKTGDYGHCLYFKRAKST